MISLISIADIVCTWSDGESPIQVKGRDLTSMTKSPPLMENKRSKMTTQKRHQNVRLHNSCEPTQDGSV